MFDLSVWLRVALLLGGMGLLGWSAMRSYEIVLVVILMLTGIAFVSRRTRRRDRAGSNKRDVLIGGALAILMLSGIAGTFKIIDSAERDTAPISFGDGLTLTSIMMLAVAAVVGASAVRYAAHSLLHRKRKRQRKVADPPAPVSPKAN